MVVQHNLQAMNANRMLGITTGQQAKSTEKLSSGYRINRAADDAAGLTISEKMRKQIRGLDRASTNAQDGVSAVQTAEGALTEVHSMLQRMNELATQASNGTNSQADRDAIQAEIEQLTTEIDRVAETTKFNETYLLKGDRSGANTTKTLSAHDAGIAGTLTDNGNGTSTFALEKALADGDTIKIAGKEYTIGKSKDVDSYVSQADAQAMTLALGDSVTSNGITKTIVDKVTATDAAGLTWANGDTFTDADGKEWTVAAATDVAKGEVKTADIAQYLKEGSVITKNANKHIGDGNAAEIAKTVKVVDELDKTDASVVDSTGTVLTAALAVGDTVTKDGVSKEVTAKTPTAFKDVADAIKALSDGDTVTIGTKSYTVAVSTDEANGKYTADDIISKIKEGDTVNDGTNDYTAIGVSATDSDKDNVITADEAYKMIAEELTKANSVGADVAGKVKNTGSGNFEITQGTVEVKKSLSFNLHVGADADMTNKITVDIDAMSAAGLGIKGINLSDDTGNDATYAIDAIADAISTVSAQRSALGAVQNRLEHTIANLDNVVENTTAAESRIRDVDMAEEMVEYSKNNILAQAGQSMLAQANQSTQGVLSLLQ